MMKNSQPGLRPGHLPVAGAKPEELGGAVVFLASDAAAYVNGHVLAVDRRAVDPPYSTSQARVMGASGVGMAPATAPQTDWSKFTIAPRHHSGVC